MAFRSSQRTLHTPILDTSSEHCNNLVIDVQRPLKRLGSSGTISSGTSTSGTTSSESSHVTMDVVPSGSGYAWRWKPPASWSGPSAAMSADEDKSPNLVGAFTFTGKKRAKGNSRGAVRDRTRLFKELEPVRLANVVVEPKEDVSVTRAEFSPPGAVEIHCYEGQHEKPVVDVIHKLRALKRK